MCDDRKDLASELLFKCLGWGIAASLTFAGWLVAGVPEIPEEGMVLGRFSFEHAYSRTILLLAGVSAANLLWLATCAALLKVQQAGSLGHSNKGVIFLLVSLVAACNIAVSVGAGLDSPG